MSFSGLPPYGQGPAPIHLSSSDVPSQPSPPPYGQKIISQQSQGRLQVNNQPADRTGPPRGALTPQFAPLSGATPRYLGQGRGAPIGNSQVPLHVNPLKALLAEQQAQMPAQFDQQVQAKFAAQMQAQMQAQVDQQVQAQMRAQVDQQVQAKLAAQMPATIKTVSAALQALPPEVRNGGLPPSHVRVGNPNLPPELRDPNAPK